MRLRVYLPDREFEWESNDASFRVGRGDSCALRIEGESAKFASWEHAEFSQQDDGAACVVDLTSSNGTYVDGARIDAAMPVRVGSVVQLGRAGARLEILELTQGESSESPNIITAPAARPSAARQPRASSKSLPPQSLLIGGAAVVVLAIVAFFVFRGTGSTSPPKEGPALARQTAPKRSDSSKPVDPQIKNTPAVQPQLPPERNPEPLDDEPVAPPTPPPVAPDPWKLAKDLGLPAYRLLVVEDPKADATFPLADAVVVGNRALLTTASAAAELAKFAERGWRMKAVTSSEDKGVGISRVRLHAAFQHAKPDVQLYFDLALLTTDGSLGQPASLASAAELAAIKRGQPLICFATNHTGDEIDGFQRLQPAVYAATVRAQTYFEAGGSRLLHLRGSFCDSAAGCPIFDDQGHLVALYCEPAPAEPAAEEPAPPESAAGARRTRAPTHFAKLIDPQLIESGLSDKENKIWVSPVVPSPAAASALQESAP